MGAGLSHLGTSEQSAAAPSITMELRVRLQTDELVCTLALLS